MFLARTKKTFEIVLSKIIPAGVGWQAAAFVFDGAGALPFALATGAGDGMAVFGGHMLWSLTMKKDLGVEKKTATLLGTGAFCSGTVWQPTVDYFCSVPMTGIVCATVFFLGLRGARTVLQEPASYVRDAGLSLSIGGAAGMFVFTDPTLVSFPLFHVLPNTAAAQACAIAGLSTGTGFTLVQTMQNMKNGPCWLDE